MLFNHFASMIAGLRPCKKPFNNLLASFSNLKLPKTTMIIAMGRSPKILYKTTIIIAMGRSPSILKKYYIKKMSGLRPSEIPFNHFARMMAGLRPCKMPFKYMVARFQT